MSASFFVAEGEDLFSATALTRGPWSPLHQHGGPPSALLARAIEARVAKEAPGAGVVRVSFDLFRPIPIGRVSISTEVLRAKKTVQMIGAVMRGPDGQELIRATALALRTEDVELPPLPSRSEPAFNRPEASQPFVFPFFLEPIGYHTGMEVRLSAGVFGQGSVSAWFRMRCPLLAGEDPSPLQRVVIAADSGNGITAMLDTRDYTFINPDLTIYLSRPPRGEWIHLAAATRPEPTGVGLTESALSDLDGPFGRSLQSLVIARRLREAGP